MSSERIRMITPFCFTWILLCLSANALAIIVTGVSVSVVVLNRFVVPEELVEKKRNSSSNFGVAKCRNEVSLLIYFPSECILIV